MSAKEFYEAFQIGRSQFNLLVHDGILKPNLEDADTKNIWSPQDGQAFVDRLLIGARVIQQAQHGWETIAKSATRLKLRPADIIRAIWDGRVQNVARNINFTGYASVHVFREEIAQVLAPEQPSALSLEKFAKIVGINNPVHLNRLVNNGHVPTTNMRNPKTKAMQRYITSQDAAVFHKKFVTLRSLSKSQGSSWQSISSKLRTAGIRPFSPDGTEYGNVFLKNEAEAALAT